MSKVDRRVKVYVDKENELPAVGRVAKTTTVSKGGRRVLADLDRGTNRAVNGRKLDSVKPSERQKIRDKVAVPSETHSDLHQIIKSEQIEENLFNVTEYVDYVYTYLRRLENKFATGKDHLKGQQLDARMRSVLVDWLADVHNHFNLQQETYQLTVYILDRYMAKVKTVTKDTAQLVGLTAMFLAAKYEETERLEVAELVFVCDAAVKDQSILKQEMEMLQALDYSLGQPLPLYFVRRYSKTGGAIPMEHTYAKYFTDLSLLDYELCTVEPSLIAAASVFLAFCITRDRISPHFWTPPLEQASKYTLTDFYDLLRPLSRLIIKNAASKTQAIRRKYSTPNYFYVSVMPGCQKTGIISQFCQ